MGRSSGSIRVLHVDDERRFVETAAEFLEREGEDIEVLTETNVEQALDRLEERSVDCVVSDYEMPGQTGIDFLETVRERYPDLPFLLFTGRGSEAVASDAISAGVTDYLQKDTGTEQYALLANRIRNAVERTNAEREREQLRERHREKANLLDEIFAQIPAMLYLKDAEGRHLRVSDRLLENTGFDRSEVIGKTDVEAYGEEDGRGTYEDDMRVVETGEAILNREEVVGEDGTTILTSKVPWYGDDGEINGVIGVSQEITEKKELEASHREKSRLLDQIFQQVPIHLYIKDREARHTHVSAWYVDENDVVPDAAVQVGKTDLELYSEELARGSYEDDLRVIQEGEPVLDREEYDPDQEEWNLTSKAPLYDENDDIQGLIGVTRQITEHKESEQRLERQNERLEEFVSIVSHDLRNPLNVATGQLELAREEYDSPRLDRVERAHDRMATLIEDLLSLARQGQQAQDLEPLRLGAAAERSLEMVETENVSLTVDSDLQFRADAGRLHQLLENLVANAVEHGSASPGSQARQDAVEHGSTSPPSTSSQEDSAERSSAGSRTQSDDAVEHGGSDTTVRVGALSDRPGFYVADDGPGIPEEQREHVFEAGYSTSETGTGFGLSIVAEIAEAHGWNVRVTDSEDGGTRFEVTGVDTDA